MHARLLMDPPPYASALARRQGKIGAAGLLLQRPESGPPMKPHSVQNAPRCIQLILAVALLQRRCSTDLILGNDIASKDKMLYHHYCYQCWDKVAT